MKKSCPACQGYPTSRAETTRPPPVVTPPLPSPSPRRVRDPLVNSGLNFVKKQAKSYPDQGNSGGGLSRVPETIYINRALVAEMIKTTWGLVREEYTWYRSHDERLEDVLSTLRILCGTVCSVLWQSLLVRSVTFPECKASNDPSLGSRGWHLDKN